LAAPYEAKRISTAIAHGAGKKAAVFGKHKAPRII